MFKLFKKKSKKKINDSEKENRKPKKVKDEIYKTFHFGKLIETEENYTTGISKTKLTEYGESRLKDKSLSELIEFAFTFLESYTIPLLPYKIINVGYVSAARYANAQGHLLKCIVHFMQIRFKEEREKKE